MRALVCVSPGHFEYREIKSPSLEAHHAILKIKRIGICGTDLHAFEGTQPYFSYPRILGHELAADLIDADDADGFVPGETVTILPYFNCGTCIACKNGKPNCCVNINVCGVHSDGAMVDYLSVPSYSLMHGGGLSYEELALIEPLAIGAHGVRRAAITQGEWVLVVGAGPIGLGTMELARVAGGAVIAADVNDARLGFCKNHLHVEHLINPLHDDAVQQMKEITGGDMPTVVIDATGNQKAINHSLQYLAHGGRYVLIGLQKDDIIFSHPEFHKRETTLLSSRNATRDDFEQVVHCIQNKLINSGIFITHRVKFPELKDEFTGWLHAGSGVIKAIVDMV
jgi:2-desacetyl-2-hydroxyethyl bacteriochlorophyllide A dehydrogenase